MENNNDQKWKLADVLANFTKSQLQKQQEIAIREEMKQRMMDAQAQNLAQFVPGAQPAPQEQGFPQDFAMAKEGGIHIDPSKRGTFRAQATRMGMSVQEAARHILSNKDKYSPKMVKKANFARNFAKEEGGEIENENYENEENENEDYEMVSGIADILQQVRDKENRKQIAENMIKDFEEEDVDYNLQKFMDMAKLKRGGEMIRRADGSYSQRGFWDNIRANKGSGKAPTKEMLAQERKIKKKRYDDGGTLPSCEEGYYWNPDKQSCEPISLNTDVQNNQEFLIKMANSPLFAERYARMTGSNNLEDTEKLRQNILNNIGSVKYEQTPRVEAKGNLGEYHPSGHIIKFSNPSATTLLHELSHASTKGHKNFSKDQVNNLKKRWNYDPYYGSNLIDEKFAHFNNVENASQPLKDFKDAYKTLSGMMFANSKSEKYLKTPTEVKAMLDVLRDKLQRKGLYDPVNEKFTEKNYNSLKEELLRNNGQGLLRTIFGENSQDNYELLQLLNNYSKEDVIDMFNSFVSNSPDTNQGYGKRGGQLGRFLL